MTIRKAFMAWSKKQSVTNFHVTVDVSTNGDRVYSSTINPSISSTEVEYHNHLTVNNVRLPLDDIFPPLHCDAIISSPNTAVTTPTSLLVPSPTDTLFSLTNTTQSHSTRTLCLADFRLQRLLGKGAYGQVFLALDNTSKWSSSVLALKVVSKKFRGRSADEAEYCEELLVNEQHILKRITNATVAQGRAWFLTLESSWHDTENFYLSTPYYLGGDLETEIVRCIRFSAERARFYMAEMIIALQYLHTLGIIHRDLKPANILFTADGHIVLADFGLSKMFDLLPTELERMSQPYFPYLRDDDPNEMILNVDENKRWRGPHELYFVSDDFCGSPMFMAPEMHLRRYYSYGVDYWAAGVILYLMICGRPPWDQVHANERDVGTMILDDPLTFFPWDPVSTVAKDFICGMLDKTPERRILLGAGILEHSYFSGINWTLMEERKVKAPWKPSCIPRLSTRKLTPVFAGKAYTRFTDPYPEFAFGNSRQATAPPTAQRPSLRQTRSVAFAPPSSYTAPRKIDRYQTSVATNSNINVAFSPYSDKGSTDTASSSFSWIESTESVEYTLPAKGAVRRKTSDRLLSTIKSWRSTVRIGKAVYRTPSLPFGPSQRSQNVKDSGILLSFPSSRR